MFPLRDVNRPQRTPIVTRLLVMLNVAAFGWQMWMSMAGQESWLLANFAVRPNCFFVPGSCGIALTQNSELLGIPLLSALFLHGGVLHLAFNMWFLWGFGPSVEDRLGRIKFPLFYLFCGIAASLFYVISHPFSTAPLIGASGAIAGVLGAHLVLLPRSWILTYLPPIWVFPVPSLLFLALWMAGQVANAFVASPLNLGGDGGVAWMAHIGGFLAGALWAWRVKPWWRKREANARPAKT